MQQARKLTQRLGVHDEWMRVGAGSGVTDLHEDGIALILFAVTVLPLQQTLHVANLTPDPTTWYCLEIRTSAQRLCGQLLNMNRSSE